MFDPGIMDDASVKMVQNPSSGFVPGSESPQKATFADSPPTPEDNARREVNPIHGVSTPDRPEGELTSGTRGAAAGEKPPARLVSTVPAPEKSSEKGGRR